MQFWYACKTLNLPSSVYAATSIEKFVYHLKKNMYIHGIMSSFTIYTFNTDGWHDWYIHNSFNTDGWHAYLHSIALVCCLNMMLLQFPKRHHDFIHNQFIHISHVSTTDVSKLRCLLLYHAVPSFAFVSTPESWVHPHSIHPHSIKWRSPCMSWWHGDFKPSLHAPCMHAVILRSE